MAIPARVERPTNNPTTPALDNPIGENSVWDGDRAEFSSIQYVKDGYFSNEYVGNY